MYKRQGHHLAAVHPQGKPAVVVRQYFIAHIETVITFIHSVIIKTLHQLVDICFYISICLLYTSPLVIELLCKE